MVIEGMGVSCVCILERENESNKSNALAFIAHVQMILSNVYSRDNNYLI